MAQSSCTHLTSSLATMPLLRGLTATELNYVISKLTIFDAPNGTVLLTQGRPQQDHLYLIHCGAVRIQLEQVDGRVAVVTLLGPQEAVGELASFGSLSCVGTIETIDRSVLLCLPKSDFQAFIGEIPVLTQNILYIFAKRLHQANQQILALTTLDAAQRVAAQLLALAQNYGQSLDGAIKIPFRLTQQTLADLTGLSRVRVNQVMSDLITQRVVVQMSNYQLAINDVIALAKQATPDFRSTLVQPTPRTFCPG